MALIQNSSIFRDYRLFKDKQGEKQLSFGTVQWDFYKSPWNALTFTMWNAKSITFCQIPWKGKSRDSYNCVKFGSGFIGGTRQKAKLFQQGHELYLLKKPILLSGVNASAAGFYTLYTFLYIFIKWPNCTIPQKIRLSQRMKQWVWLRKHEYISTASAFTSYCTAHKQ